MRRDKFFGLICAAFLAFTVNSASAKVVNLSDVSSCENIIPSSALPIKFDFSVSGYNLTLTVTNYSQYYINGIWFNYDTDKISLFTYNDTVAHWDFTSNSEISGYGTFNAQLHDDGHKNHMIEPGSPSSGKSKVFTFSFTGTGVTDNDFASKLTSGSNITASYAAAAFYTLGVKDAGVLQAYGLNVVPEPATIALLGLGGLLLCRKKRT